MFAANYQALRVILADDQLVVRNCVKAILEDEDLQVVGVAPDGAEAVRLCRELKPDVAVLDISMDRLDGFGAARAIRTLSSGTKIVLLTMHPEEAFVLEAFRAGASAYVLKTEAWPALLDAISAVMHGEIYLSPGVPQVAGAGPVSPVFATTR